MKEKGEVLVYLQHNDKSIAEPSIEILGKGCELASKLNVPVSGVIIGENISSLAKEAICMGAQKVYVVDSPVLKKYTSCSYEKAICGLVKKIGPYILLFAATFQGRDIAPRVSSALWAGLTADCTDLKLGSYIDPKTKKKYDDILYQIRPAWGGNIIATIVSPDTLPQMATIREGIMKLPEYNSSAKGEIINIGLEITQEDLLTDVVEQVFYEKKVNLKQAGVIVAGGAGVGSKENFQLIHKLARALGGEVGATRAAVDAGFISHDHQIGQTGITVRPKVYIACGISGAVQHLSGMDESGKIIAVNTDSEAPVFGIAHYGIIGDLREVIPIMINSYKNLSH